MRPFDPSTVVWRGHIPKGAKIGAATSCSLADHQSKSGCKKVLCCCGPPTEHHRLCLMRDSRRGLAMTLDNTHTFKYTANMLQAFTVLHMHLCEHSAGMPCKQINCMQRVMFCGSCVSIGSQALPIERGRFVTPSLKLPHYLY